MSPTMLFEVEISSKAPGMKSKWTGDDAARGSGFGSHRALAIVERDPEPQRAEPTAYATERCSSRTPRAIQLRVQLIPSPLSVPMQTSGTKPLPTL